MAGTSPAMTGKNGMLHGQKFEEPMIPTLKPGAALARLDGPVIETERLKLRMWCEADIEPNTAMLADPDSGRFITADGKPITDAFVGWRNATIMAGHWAL